MRRRTVCTSVGGAMCFLSGCSGVLAEFGGGTSLRTDRIEDTEFEAGTRMEPLFDCWQDAVTVTRMPANDRIEVSGQIESGGRSCMKTTLETAGLDERSNTLVVVVTDEKKGGVSGCTMEEALVRYDATITLRESVPNRIRVRHRSELGRDESRYRLDETLVFEGGERNRETKAVSC